MATATAWILLPDLGTVRLTICLSSSDRMDGIVAGDYKWCMLAVQRV